MAKPPNYTVGARRMLSNTFSFVNLQDPQGVAEGICEASLPVKKITANFGSSVHLSCAIDNIDHPINWYFYDIKDKRHPVTESTSKYVFTQNNGLVIIGKC